MVTASPCPKSSSRPWHRGFLNRTRRRRAAPHVEAADHRCARRIASVALLRFSRETASEAALVAALDFTSSSSWASARLDSSSVSTFFCASIALTNSLPEAGRAQHAGRQIGRFAAPPDPARLERRHRPSSSRFPARLPRAPSSPARVRTAGRPGRTGDDVSGFDRGAGGHHANARRSMPPTGGATSVCVRPPEDPPWHKRSG